MADRIRLERQASVGGQAGVATGIGIVSIVRIETVLPVDKRGLIGRIAAQFGAGQASART